MNTINYVRIVFCMLISVMMILGSLINSFEHQLPVFIQQTMRYGKFAYTGKPSIFKPLEVPKSWFKHFYIYSSVLTSFTLGLTIKIYFFHSIPPVWLKDLLDNVGGHLRDSSVTQIHVLLALILLTIQCVRRLYDTHFVSVFGKTATMNLSHYAIGFIHYTGSILAILIEAPIYAATVGESKINLFDLQINDLLATALFLWACLHQYKITVILANLRKNSKGEVVTQEHKLPKGDWFLYLSSPHNMAEILMYFSLTVILWGNITWLFVFLWVLSNQVETSLLSHWWYQETFKDFPPDRKALIPFIY